MTYVPPAEGKRRATGRPAKEIPEALLAQLRHSRDTGAKCEIDREPDDDPADVAELRRTIKRAGVRHFPSYTIHVRTSETLIKFWIGPKKRGHSTGEEQ